MMISIISLILLIVIIAFLFVNISPVFGGKHSDSDIERYEATGYYSEGIFINLIPTSLDMGYADMLKTMKQFIKGVPNSRPDFDLPVNKLDSLALTQFNGVSELIWFGHSTFLLRIDGKNILIDPMFGDVPAPHPWLGKKRYSKELPIEIEKLPSIDAIIISHDHYDHLDYGSIQKLKDKTKSFFVPMGVATHFKKWGVADELIHELNWWDEIDYEDLNLIFAPARHFSGRGMTNRNTTLWGSWIIRGKSDTIYFSGDSGYGPHFKEIGEKYGPFNFAMMECGQYNEKWSQIHMMPEETAQAAVDLNTEVMMPIHWGAFTLSLHSWTDPVTRVRVKANELNMPVIVPIIGEVVILDDDVDSKNKEWWLNN